MREIRQATLAAKIVEAMALANGTNPDTARRAVMPTGDFAKVATVSRRFQ